MQNQKVISDTIKGKDVSPSCMFKFRKPGFLSVSSDVVACKIFSQHIKNYRIYLL